MNNTKQKRLYAVKGQTCWAWMSARWVSCIFIERTGKQRNGKVKVEVRETGKRELINRNYVRFRQDAPLHAPYRRSDGRPLAADVSPNKYKINVGTEIFFWWSKRWNKGTVHSIDRADGTCVMDFEGELIPRHLKQVSYKEPTKPLYKISEANNMKNEDGVYTFELGKEAILKALKEDNWREIRRIVHRLDYAYNFNKLKPKPE